MNELSDLAHIIELSVAPVFLLAGIGAFLNVMAARLARIVDRSRTLEARCGEQPDQMEIERIRSELSILDKRTLYAQRAIFLFSFAALLVCLVVAALFVGDFIDLAVGALVALMFIAAMFAMIGGLALFLMEISIATRTLRVRPELFSKQ